MELAWQHFRPQARASLDERVPFEVVHYLPQTAETMKRLPGEFHKALQLLAEHDRSHETAHNIAADGSQNRLTQLSSLKLSSLKSVSQPVSSACHRCIVITRMTLEQLWRQTAGKMAMRLPCRMHFLEQVLHFARRPAGAGSSFRQDTHASRKCGLSWSCRHSRPDGCLRSAA